MKKLLKSALIAGCILLTGSFAKAQSKVGYINFQALITGAAEFPGLQAQINAYSKTWSDQIQAMQADLNKEANDYEAKKGTMTDAMRTKTEGELQDLNKRIQDNSTTAQNQVNAKTNEIIKPLVDKLKAAISAVAKENGYNYVIDSSSTEFLVSPEADDLMARVKAKLGPATAPASAPAKKP